MILNNPIKVPCRDMESETSEDGFRIYTTPDGVRMPSITSVLKDYNKKAIEDWKERVGEEEAARVLHVAGWRGSAVHEALENYLLGKPYETDNYPVMRRFSQIKEVLEGNMTEWNSLEVSLYSDMLGVAGQSDLVGVFQEQRSIIDFKTARKRKKKAWIHSYFLQCAFYAFAYYERTGIFIPQLVVIVANAQGGPDVFVEKLEDWLPKLVKYIAEWKDAHDIS